jgi:hypothetical protein
VEGIHNIEHIGLTQMASLTASEVISGFIFLFSSDVKRIITAPA